MNPLDPQYLLPVLEDHASPRIVSTSISPKQKLADASDIKALVLAKNVQGLEEWLKTNTLRSKYWPDIWAAVLEHFDPSVAAVFDKYNIKGSYHQPTWKIALAQPCHVLEWYLQHGEAFKMISPRMAAQSMLDMSGLRQYDKAMVLKNYLASHPVQALGNFFLWHGYESSFATLVEDNQSDLATFAFERVWGSEKFIESYKPNFEMFSRKILNAFVDRPYGTHVQLQMFLQQASTTIQTIWKDNIFPIQAGLRARTAPCLNQVDSDIVDNLVPKNALIKNYLEYMVARSSPMVITMAKHPQTAPKIASLLIDKPYLMIQLLSGLKDEDKAAVKSLLDQQNPAWEDQDGNTWCHYLALSAHGELSKGMCQFLAKECRDEMLKPNRQQQTALDWVTDQKAAALLSQLLLKKELKDNGLGSAHKKKSSNRRM